MKKTIKAILLAILIGVVLFSLAGCGNKDLVATKTVEDEITGNYKEEVRITFKDDKAETVKITMEYEKEEVVEEMYSVFSMLGTSEDEGIKVEKDGNKIMMEISSEAYSEMEGESEEDMTREAIKKALEEEGYTVK